MKVLDITKFYSASSGGVKTYLDAKMEDFAQRGITHTLVVPGEPHGVTVRGKTRMVTIGGPVNPFSKAYRLIISPESVARAIREAAPDVIEPDAPS